MQDRTIRTVLAGLFLVALAGCGRSLSGDSYTATSLDEIRAGNSYDIRVKKMRRTAKEVTAVESKVKNLPAGSR